MRKGADCLSKWVGEAERQLRLLFEQARRYQPSIIFFDEIDGLTPVRSSKQDQIHSSIVSTLLALMDGLDNRGQVIVIGATNRVDAIDPALRRPGRFDRELFFSLPNKQARSEILGIHLRKWNPPVPESVQESLSELTAGYAGADLKALCTEAALCALHRTYPAIYASTKKLKIDRESIHVTIPDFLTAMRKITPSSQRSGPQHADPLPSYLRCLFQRDLERSLSSLYSLFPFFSWEQGCNLLRETSTVETDRPPLCFSPRFLLYGEDASALDVLAKSILYAMDGCYQVHLDSLSLVQGGSLSETIASGIREACAHTPSVLFLPRIDMVSQKLEEVCSLLSISLSSVSAVTPVLLFATSCVPLKELDEEAASLFAKPCSVSEVCIEQVSTEMEEQFITQLLPSLLQYSPPLPDTVPELEEVEVVEEPPKEPMLTPEELEVLKEKEDHYLRELRNFFREVLFALSRNSRYRCFCEPVKEEDVPDYYEIIKNPMSFDDMFVKLDQHVYVTLDLFMKDILLIQFNAKEYNPNTSSGKRIVRAAAGMVDDVESTLHRFRRKLGYDLFKRCDEIAARRKEAAGRANELTETLQTDSSSDEQASSVVSQSSRATSESSRVTSESSRVTPESSRVTPELSHVTPESSQATPTKSSHTTPTKSSHTIPTAPLKPSQLPKTSPQPLEETTTATERTGAEEALVDAGRKALLLLLHRHECKHYDELLGLYSHARQMIAKMDAQHLPPTEKVLVRSVCRYSWIENWQLLIVSCFRGCLLTRNHYGGVTVNLSQATLLDSSSFFSTSSPPSCKTPFFITSLST